MAGLLTAEVVKLTSIPRQLLVSLSPRPKRFMCRFQSVECFVSFGGLLDQGASPPKMKKRGGERIEGAGRIPSGDPKRAAILRASYALRGERMDRLSQGNQKAFLQDSSRTGRAKATLARGPRVS
jgi:hypothetical protein